MKFKGLIVVACFGVAVLCSAVSHGAQWSDLEAQWQETADASYPRVPARFGRGWDVSTARKPIVFRPSLSLPHDYTLETWFRIDDPAGRSTLFSSIKWRRFVVTIADASVVTVRLYDQSGQKATTVAHEFGYEFTPGRWYHFAITSSRNGGHTFYVNGQPVHRVPTANQNAKTTGMAVHSIGAYSINGKGDYDHYFKGILDRPAFIARTLSSQEVMSRYRLAVAVVDVSPIPQQVEYLSEKNVIDAGRDGEREGGRDAGGVFSLEVNAAHDKLSHTAISRLRENLGRPHKDAVIVLSNSSDTTLPEYLKPVVAEGIPNEGYVLGAKDGRIDIICDDPRGMTYGVDTLMQLLQQKYVPEVIIYDYPEFSYRAGLYVSNSKPPTSIDDVYGNKSSLKDAFRDFSQARMNAVMLRLYDWAWLDRSDSREAAAEIVNLAKDHQLDVIPYLQCYGHAKMFLWRDIRAGHTVTVDNEEVVLVGDEPVALAKNNVIITRNTPVLVVSADGETLQEGKDFQVVDGELNLEWDFPARLNVRNPWVRPYIREDNKPFAIRRLSGGRINDGDRVTVTYDIASGGPGYCPSSPITHEIVNASIENVIRNFDPKYISLAMDEVWEPRSTDGRCCAQVNAAKLSNAELLRREMNRALTFARSIKPDIRVMFYSDMIDENQTPRWFSTWQGIDEQVDLVDPSAVMMPWYYGTDMDSLWRINQSSAYFAEKGFEVIGASSFSPMNVYLWGQSLARLNGRHPVGFTITLWAGRGVISDGYHAYAQNTWSPSRFPAVNMLRLRMALDAMGVTSDLQAEAISSFVTQITTNQKQRLQFLLVGAEDEKRSVDLAGLSSSKGLAMNQLLTAIDQARAIVAMNAMD